MNRLLNTELLSAVNVWPDLQLLCHDRLLQTAMHGRTRQAFNLSRGGARGERINRQYVICPQKEVVGCPVIDRVNVSKKAHLCNGWV